jgi:hypothetical protein
MTVERSMRPLEKEASLAWWDANVTGSDEAFARKAALQNKIDEALVCGAQRGRYSLE